MLSAPDSPISSLGLLPAAEHLLIESWQQDQTSERTEPQKYTSEIVREIQAHAQIQPTKAAITNCERTISYAELIRHCEAISKIIEDNCAQANDIIAIASTSRIDTILAMISCYYCQRAFVIIDPSAPIRHTERILTEINRGPIITSKISTSETLNRIAFQRPRISIAFNQNRSLDITFTKGLAKQHGLEANPFHDLAYAIFTSGST